MTDKPTPALSRFADWATPGAVQIHTPKQCNNCVHLDTTRPDIMGCSAFPQGIPGVILTDEFDHTKPYPGDNGVRFEKKSG